MNLTEEQKTLIQNLQQQEELCIQKYTEFGKLAHDPALKSLFGTIKQQEETHYHSLSQLLNGNCPEVSEKQSMAEQYQPTPTYTGSFNQEDKEYDQFLCSDTIATEKYVSTAYNDELFRFGDNNVRKLLNNIQTEEQDHAEMIYQYKCANQMV